MIFCKHDWVILSETTTKSKFEVAISLLQGSGEVDIPGQMCKADRKFIQVFTCKKCGKLQRFVEDI